GARADHQDRSGRQEDRPLDARRRAADRRGARAVGRRAGEGRGAAGRGDDAAELTMSELEPETPVPTVESPRAAAAAPAVLTPAAPAVAPRSRVPIFFIGA